MKRIFVLFLLIIFFCLSGCSSREPTLHLLSDLGGQKICKVALLPFINNSDYDQGHLIVQRIFETELNNAVPVEIVAEGDVRKIYQQLRIYPNQMPDLEQLRVLGSRLGVQALIGAKVMVMEEKTASSCKVNPMLAINFHVFDGKTGRSLWTSYYRKEGREYQTVMHFGQINTISELSRIMSREIIEKWFSKGVMECEG